MKYICICSGIGAATQAWLPLDWDCLFHSEIDKFARTVLESNHPDTSIYGDFTKIDGDYNADLLVGGPPCQAFSHAGWRRGMDDPRGNLSIEYVRFVERYEPTWIVYENVPGILSSSGGGDFKAVLQALEQLGYGVCWRMLDAQYFGVPQQRKRLFMVGYRGDWRPAASVLFERHSMQRNFAPSQAYEPYDAIDIVPLARLDYFRLQGFGNYCESQVSGPIKARDYKSPTDLVLKTNFIDGDPVHSIRRLSLTELERLQGLPDGYTKIKWRGKSADKCPNEPRYRVLGNTMAVPVMTWIGERIERVRLLLSA